MLLDEPLAGIDPIAVGDIRALIGYLKTKGIWRSHHRPQCPRYCLEIVDRAYILHDGRVLMEGTARRYRQSRRCSPRLSGRRFFALIF
jgi:lipopolysaccharide export system ATP-binding protein